MSVTEVLGMSDQQRLFSSRVWQLRLDPPSREERAARLEVLGAKAPGASATGALALHDAVVVTCGGELLGRVASCEQRRWRVALQGSGIIPVEVALNKDEHLWAEARAPRLWPIARNFLAPEVQETKQATFAHLLDRLADLDPEAIPPTDAKAAPDSLEEARHLRRTHWSIYGLVREYRHWESRHILDSEVFSSLGLAEDEVTFDTIPGWEDAAREYLYKPLLAVGPIVLNAFYQAVYYEQLDGPREPAVPYGDLLERPNGYFPNRYNTDAPDSVLLYEALGTLEDVLQLSLGPCGAYWLEDFIDAMVCVFDGFARKWRGGQEFTS